MEAVQCALFALHHHLEELKMEAVLSNPDVDAAEEDSSTSSANIGSSSSNKILNISGKSAEYFELDAVTARDLEIFHSSAAAIRTQSNLWSSFAKGSTPGANSGPKEVSGSTLFGVLDQCKTPFGRRVLQRWTMQPLCQLEGIQLRQQAVRWLADASERMARYNTTDAATWAFNLAAALAGCTELESLLTALQHGRINPRRLLRLYKAAEALLPVSPSHACYTSAFEDIPALVTKMVESVSFRTVQQGVELCVAKIDIDKAGQDAIVDIFVPAAVEEFPDLCSLRRALNEIEIQLHAELVRIRALLKIPTLEYRSLRTGPVSSIEHLIELPVGQAQRVPADWIKSNSTKQVERYHAPSVIALQDRLYQLRDEVKGASREAWQSYVAQVRDLLHAPLRAATAALGQLDALLSLSRLCKLPGFVEPVYTSACDELAISGGRHPMVERHLESRGEPFIPNDVLLRCNFQPQSCQVVTGPNMGGKSSYVRTIALICLLGQIGAHVPADSARLCIFDRIFTRMGAGDDLAAGHSTFMSELYRTNYILQRATPRSLVILDELGRGTATNDGLAIAQATLTYALRTLGSAVLFVTHFPQIADLVEAASSAGAASSTVRAGDSAGTLPPGRAVNVHMGYVHNTTSGAKDEVVFLYKAVRATLPAFA